MLKISGSLFTTTTEMKRGVLDLIPAGLRTLHVPDQPHRTHPRAHMAPGRPFLSLRALFLRGHFHSPLLPTCVSPPHHSHWTSILGGLQAVTSAVGTGLPPSDHGSLTHTVTSPPTSQPDASILGSHTQSGLVEGGSGREALWARALRRTQVDSACHLVFTRGTLHVSGTPEGPLLPCPRHASP